MLKNLKKKIKTPTGHIHYHVEIRRTVREKVELQEGGKKPGKMVGMGRQRTGGSSSNRERKKESWGRREKRGMRHSHWVGDLIEEISQS